MATEMIAIKEELEALRADFLKFQMFAYNSIDPAGRIQISRNEHPFLNYVDKFGKGTIASSATREVHDAGSSYTYLSAGAIHEVAGGANDVKNTGTGAWTVEIQGLDGDFLPATEIVDMNGATVVDTSTEFSRIFSAKVLTAGSGGTNADNITITEKSGGSIVSATIIAEKGQTNMALYTVPSNKKGYLVSYYASLLRASGTSAAVADVDIYERELDGANAWRSKKPLGIHTYRGSINYEWVIPVELSAKTDVKVVVANGTTEVEVAAGFFIWLVNN